jgi:hypothetical protein
MSGGGAQHGRPIAAPEDQPNVNEKAFTFALASIAASMSLFAFMMTPGRQRVSQLISRGY